MTGEPRDNPRSEDRVEQIRQRAAAAAQAGHITWAEADRLVCAAYEEERRSDG